MQNIFFAYEGIVKYSFPFKFCWWNNYWKTYTMIIAVIEYEKDMSLIAFVIKSQ